MLFITKALVIFTFVPLIPVFGAHYCQDVPCFPDYYWREYEGAIPCDAVPGGKGTHGDAFFIAQVYSDKFGVLPATISQKEPSIAISSSDYKVFRSNRLIKILCSRNQERFRWISADSAPHSKIVQGGNHKKSGRVYYIGRTFYQNAQRLGKVDFPDSGSRELRIPAPDGTTEIFFTDFEILTYGCQNSEPFNSDTQENHYWEDYENGVIPHNAVLGGYEFRTGEPIFVGQTYVERYGILPAAIYPRKKIALAQAGNAVYKQTRKIKVLCSNWPENLQWVPTRSETLSGVSGKIIGGSEKSTPLFIGRITIDGDDLIGKVFANDRPNRGLWYVRKNRREHSLSYDVLRVRITRTKSPENATETPEEKIAIAE